MLSMHFFLDLSIILLGTKVMGLFTKRFNMPQVVGALFAGLIIGPACLNIVHETEFIDKMAELGVIILMFLAGLETDVKELKKSGKASFIMAVLGVLVPLIGGYVVAIFFNNGGSVTNLDSVHIIQNIFIGVVLTATSVSITVETLREMGKLKTRSGTAILGAAVIDDILGIIILTIISSFQDPSVSIVSVSLKIVLFFVFAAVCGLAMYYIFNYLGKKYNQKRRMPILGLVLCLLLSYTAEEYFGIANITGAYLAGIIISSTFSSEYMTNKYEVLSYMLLAPIFFASIGIKTSIGSLDGTILLFALLLLVVAILSKVLGCGLGAKVCGYSNEESLQIGVGMISRGEVALIVANKGAAIGLMNEEFFTPLIIVVIVTTLITPILLKLVYRNKSNGKISSCSY